MMDEQVLVTESGLGCLEPFYLIHTLVEETKDLCSQYVKIQPL